MPTRFRSSPQPAPRTRVARPAGAARSLRAALALGAGLALGAALCLPAGAAAQGRAAASPAPVAKASSSLLTPAWVKGRIAAAETDKSISDVDRPQVLQAYRDALVALEAAQAHRTAAAEFRRAAERAAATGRAPQVVADAQAASAAARAATEGITERTTVEEVEQRLIREQTALDAARKQRVDTERLLAAEAGRPQESRAELAEARAAADRLESQLTAPAPPDEGRTLAEAKRALTAARRDEQLALVERLEQEILTYEPRVQLLGVDRDRAAAELARQVARVDAVEQRLYEARAAAAREAQAAAQRALEQAVARYPALAPVASRGVELGSRLPKLAQRARELAQEREREDRELASLDRDFERLRPQLTGTEGHPAYGQALIVYREQLGRLPSRAARHDEVLEEVSRVGAELHRAEDERAELSDLGAAVARAMAETGLDRLPGGERGEAAATVEGLLREQRALLDRTTVALQGELRTLAELAATLAGIDRRATEFRTAIDSRLLWARTLSPVDPDTLGQLPRALMRTAGVGAWQRLFQSMTAAPPVASAAAVLVVAIAGLLVAARGRLVRRLEATAQPVSAKAEGLRRSIEAIVLTFLLSVPVPALLLAAGGLALSSSPQSVPRGLAAGLMSAGSFALALTFARQVFRPGGLATSHFGWPLFPGSRLWSEFRWAVPVTAVLMCLAVAAASGSVSERQSLARLAYFLLGVVSAFAMHRVLRRPPGSAEAPLHGHRLLYAVAVVLPVLFALLPIAGYGFTAFALGARLIVSFWLVGSVLMLMGLANRLLSLHLAHERAAAADGQGAAAADLEDFERSARFLMRGVADFAFVVGLWWIWSSLLPVLSSKTTFSPWTRPEWVGGVQQQVPVTAGDLFVAAMIAVLTVVAARNIPGALKILLKSTAGTDPSLRVAFSTVAQYLIVGGGTFSALTIVGADWSKLQWLVAALGVGLGFGLQEIVANFVCGLIILFERPIRPGDVVTVGGITGTVTRISVRATHITDFDRKSVVVPNKSLITDQVTNWTLSDQVTRVVITVGVAYGSEPQRVQRLLLDVARGLPNVLATPAPTVQLMRFAESSLDFEARLFVSRLDDRLGATHDFHVAAERALREHGIEIPFPQRDLNVRTWPAAPGPAGAPAG